MKVKKRNGNLVDMKFDSVTQRIFKLTDGLSPVIRSDKISQQIISSMHDGISTSEIDTLTAEIAIGMITEDPDYEILATRIVASNIHKLVPNSFFDAMKILHKNNILGSLSLENYCE